MDDKIAENRIAKNRQSIFFEGQIFLQLIFHKSLSQPKGKTVNPSAAAALRSISSEDAKKRDSSP